MKSWQLLWPVLLLTRAVAAQQGPAVYVDPVLRLLTQPAARQAIERAPRLGIDIDLREQPLAGRVALRRASALSEPRVAVFVQLRDPSGLNDLRALGATIGSNQNGIATVELPLSALDRLSTISGIVAVEAAQVVTINHDSSARAIRLNEVRRVSADGVWTGSTGQGVIVAIYDTGLDFRHQDFRDPSGATRVLALWDQTRTGTPPAGFTFGNLCTREAIQRVIDNPGDTSPCSQTDTNGHGTHTAGSAAGDGSDVGNGGTAFQYAGVAPMADLMIVKGGNGSFTEANILDGIRWLEQQSRALNRPMVVNLSLGGQAGAHDGSRLYEAGIDQLSRPGFMVVISSGNEGSNGNIRNRDGSVFNFVPVYIHGTGNAITGGTSEFTFQVPNYTQVAPACNEAVGFSLWYKPQDRLRITLVRPDNSAFTVDPGARQSQDHSQGNIVIDNAFSTSGNPNPNPLNGDLEVLVQTNDCGTTGVGPAAGLWRLRVTTIGTGSGQPFHFWMNTNALGGGAAARGLSGYDNRYIVGSPGNAKRAITVGAYATRMCWPTTAGLICFLQVEEIGDLARFSSGGPTRDGRVKPEITAPGIAVVSALSRNASAVVTRTVPDGVHAQNQGTSMAAPHVTGAIALLLEARASLTPEDVKDIFSRTARRDAFTNKTYGSQPGSAPSDWWGFGKLDVQAALCGVGSTSGGTAFVSVSPALDTLPQNATVKVEACVVGAAPTFESTNPTVATVDASGVVRALQLGTTLIIARAGTSADTAVITVVAPSTLIAAGVSVAPTARTRARARTVLPLLNLSLRADGVENVTIESLTFVLSGYDPGARIVIYQDLNRNGALETTDRLVGSGVRGSNAVADTVTVSTPGLTIAARADMPLLVGLDVSGAAPNNTTFAINFLASRTRSVGARSGARDRITPVAGAVLAASAATTVLEAAEVFSLSENPVRSDRVVFNFRERPSTAGIYTLSGRRVRDLTRAIDHDGQVVWTLENEDGNRVAPGIYLIVFRVAGETVREKLFILPTR
jgi:subtilisin family serine protease